MSIDIYVGNPQLMKNWTKLPLKDAKLNEGQVEYLKALTQKGDGQKALDQYLKWTGWQVVRKMVKGKLTPIYEQTPVAKRIEQIKMNAALTNRYTEVMK